MIIEIYCDGSSEGNSTGKGGWAYVICKDGVKIAEGSGHLPKATNNVAEIRAAIEGLLTASLLPEVVSGNLPGVNRPSIVLISDSQLVLKYATGEYVCRKYHLIPLYIELKRRYQAIGATTRWVKGHSGDINNERCDVLAKAAKENNAISTTPVLGTTISQN
jgi:ribonuclease HI